MSKKDPNNRWGMGKKALASIIIFTLLITLFMSIGGSVIFDRAIQKMYNDRGYVVANIILDEIDHEKIAEYSRTWTPDDYYYEMSEYLRSIQKFSSAAYIYIGVPYENKTIKYIYDSGSEMGFEDPISAPFDEIWLAYTEGIKPSSYLVRKSQYGFLTSSCLPVKDNNGDIVALLFVDTNMEVIRSTLYRYVLNMGIIAVTLLGVFCLLNWYFMQKNILKPIMILRENVKNFASNNASNDSTLLTIKTNDEMEDLARSVNSMEDDIARYIEDIQNITAEKERISAELGVARQIQADMLPSVFPPFPERKDFDIYAMMAPAKEVGGDFYDFFFIDDDHLALVMADVAGKGVPAALFMVNTKTLIKNRALMGEELSPGKILKDVNNQLCEGNESGLFVTAWLGIIQLSTGEGVAANAGHEHPVIKRREGKYELVVYKHSPAVAAIEGMKFREHEFILYPGDSLFIYTDGVAEATNNDSHMFGTDRMLNALNRHTDLDSKSRLKRIKKEIDAFVGDAPQFDDITMLEFKYFGHNGAVTKYD